MMEDMKGKIRVFARVRPMLGFEADRGHKNALNIPDELTLDHIWKDKKREYSFDAVFSPDASQDKVGPLRRANSALIYGDSTIDSSIQY